MNLATEHLAIKAFAAELEEQIREQVGADGTSSAALAEVFLGYLEEHGITAEAQMCPFEEITGRKRCAVTAVAIGEVEERLDIFLSAYLPFEMEPATLPASELADVASKAARFFNYATKGEWDRFKGSEETLDAARRVHALAGQLSGARIFILTNAIARERDVEPMEIAGIVVHFEVMDVERLHRLTSKATSRQDIEIDFVATNGRPLACLEMQPRAAEYDTYLAIFSGKMLFDLYERYGQRLFEFNVRSFLQAKGKVNKGIRETLREYPDRFMAFNNGIVATADSLEIGQFHGETAIHKIIGLQIVNGAQTTASIHRASKVDKVDLNRVSIAVKITKVTAERLQVFVPQISRFANTQNVIQVADLSANNDFHIEASCSSAGFEGGGQQRQDQRMPRRRTMPRPSSPL